MKSLLLAIVTFASIQAFGETPVQNWASVQAQMLRTQSKGSFTDQQGGCFMLGRLYADSDNLADLVLASVDTWGMKDQKKLSDIRSAAMGIQFWSKALECQDARVTLPHLSDAIDRLELALRSAH